MKKYVIIVGLASLLLAGCATQSAPTKEEMASFRPINTQLAFDDPKPIFNALFPHGSPIRKDQLETEAEFRARLAALGLEGKEFTFLIPPALCKVQPFPERSFYVITVKDTFYMGYNPRNKPYGISVARISEETDQYVGQNAYGAKADVRMYRGTYLQVAPIDFLKLPQPLRWTDGESTAFASFGLSIKIIDPAFRDKLRAEKIGLAVRVKVSDLAKMDVDYDYAKPTITNPVGFNYTKPLLPVVLLDAWIVDTDTNISLIHWHNEKKG